MSWTKRPGGGAPPAPEPYAPQAFGNQPNMYPNYPGAGTATNQQQQHYWQMQQQQQQQPQQQQPGLYPQYGQGYQHQEYSNANQFYQQPVQQVPAQYNQNYQPNSSLNNTQPGYQQNYYQNQGAQQQPKYPQNKNGDGWEDNWDWGWDEAKQAQNASQANPVVSSHSQPLPPQQGFHNANIIEESFASSDTWNWSLEDKKDAKAPETKSQQQVNEPPTVPLDSSTLENTSGSISTAQNVQPLAEDVKTLNDREVVKERLPNLALGKRFHLDNLTPQWSIESQMSQESSDGPHTHSESTYRSENQSRNSSKSSPGFNTDNTNFNYSQTGFDEANSRSEWSRQSADESTMAENERSSSRFDSHDNITETLQEMSISNCENPALDITHNSEVPTRTLQESKSLPVQAPPSVTSFLPPTPTTLPLPSSSLPPPPVNLPPPPVSLPPPPVSLPPPSTLTSTHLITPIVSNNIPPPTSYPPATSTNPFKLGGAFSHKSAAKLPTASGSSSSSFPTSVANTNLSSPSVVNKVSQQNRMPDGYGANLETTPDNSERPDQPLVPTFRPIHVSQPVPENLEVAPQNDRNEYLQTAHLSSSDYVENTDFSQISHLGLHRMVVGQQENEYSQNINISGDEPPPGLSRMVPGQQTEADGYNQPSDNYLDRHIDGQPTDNSERPFRQGDGQQMADNYSQQLNNRNADRRPIGLDRMVPGEPSNDEYSQYQTSSYSGANEHRVVPGVDDYPISTDTGPSSVREQNVDGSDYTDRTSRNASRNVIGARESSNDISPDFSLGHDDQQREVTMEGENLQDLSAVSPVEMAYSRGQMFEGVDENLTDVGADRKTDLSDSIDHPVTSSRRQSLNRVTSGEDSERDRAFKSSPRRDRDKHKSTRDRDRDRDRDGRYRDERKYERDHPERRSGREDRRSEKDRRDRDRKERDGSPERRHRRYGPRYETEDTDYYSDREKERRRYREGSYTSKPPRPDDKDRRYDERERSRRYNTIERDRRYEDEWDGASRSRRGERHRDKYERRYRDIDPTRRHGNLRREEEERRRGEPFPGESRAESRGASEEELPAAGEARRSQRRRHRGHTYYTGYEAGTAGYDPMYALQRQQYQYYEQLRLADPAAYMQLYKQLMAGQQPQATPGYEGFSSLGYPTRGDAASVHSGRSSAGLKGHDPWGGSLRGAADLRAELSDREMTTDASLNLQLEESTVRSERLTPFKFSTAHVRASVGSGALVVVRGSFPVDGRPAAVHVMPLRAARQHDPSVQLLADCPSPFVRGVTHKKSAVEYCRARVACARREGGADAGGYALLWRLLALLLAQNGVVVGSDLAELLMQKDEFEPEPEAVPAPHTEDSVEEKVEEEPLPNIADLTLREEPAASSQHDALQRFRDLVLLGNQQEALETAMSNGLWGHALYIAWFSGRRVRAATLQRFRASLPPTDPLHTLYCTLHATAPPAATCVSDARWGSWRAHAAVVLANCSARPDEDRKTLLQMGDSLLSRGLLYSAQFCYIAAGETMSTHPTAPLQPTAACTSAPPRLALLLADARTNNFRELATDQAIIATEIYEYALSLNQDYVLPELQVYKFVLACRLVDAGLHERALAYTEVIARAVQRNPELYSAPLVSALAVLADRLKYHDPALAEDPPLEEAADSSEGSPRHQLWLDQLSTLVAQKQDASRHATPQHAPVVHDVSYVDSTHDVSHMPSAYDAANMPPAHDSSQMSGIHDASLAPAVHNTQDVNDWLQQTSAPAYQIPSQPSSADYPQYYQPPPPPVGAESLPSTDSQYHSYTSGELRPEEQQTHSYWQGDNIYGGYGETEGARPMITMPGGSAIRRDSGGQNEGRPPSADLTDRETDTPKPDSKKQDSKSKDEGRGEGGARGKGGWFGGILTKLSLRPNNQMILPEDTNPSIVWDEQQKRWRNVDGDDDDTVSAPPPPPRAAPPAELPPAAGLPSPPVSNIFKMQRGRHIKNSYVDVLNPGGAAAGGGAAAPAPPAPLAAPPPPNNYFVPQMFTPSQASLNDEHPQPGM